MKIEIEPNTLAVLFLSKDIIGRDGLHAGDAIKAATVFVAKHDEAFVRCFCTLAMDRNVIRTQREWARRAGVKFEQFESFWRGMRKAKVRGTDGVKRHLFRARYELLSAASTKDDAGGVGLHLSGDGAVQFALNASIAKSWAPIQRTINETSAGAMDRISADETVSMEERAAVESAVDEARGVVASETLPLFVDSRKSA